MDRHFHTNSPARAINRVQRNSVAHKSMNSTLGRSNDSRGQSPFSLLLCVLLLVGAGMLVKFGPAVQSFYLVH